MPVPGRRMLVRAGADEAYYTNVLAAAAAELCDRLGASSVHATFLSETRMEGARCARLPAAQRPAAPWRNEGYAAFEDFLGRLASRKRKAVRKEREQALSGDLVIERVSGADIKEKHWDAFFDFYTDTGSRKWGRPYLNRRFFSLLGASMADRCLLIMARRGRRYVAGALISSAAIASTAATGARSSITRTCTSRSATIRPSTTRSSMGSRVSRRAPRASTSWRAATCRRRPTRRIGSPIRGCGAPSRATCRRSGRRSPRTSPRWPSTVPTARASVLSSRDRA